MEKTERQYESEKAKYLFCPQILALLCQILSQQMFTQFLTFMSKNPQHDCVKPRGGGTVGQDGDELIFENARKKRQKETITL